MALRGGPRRDQRNPWSEPAKDASKVWSLAGQRFGQSPAVCRMGWARQGAPILSFGPGALGRFLPSVIPWTPRGRSCFQRVLDGVTYASQLIYYESTPSFLIKGVPLQKR